MIEEIIAGAVSMAARDLYGHEPAPGSVTVEKTKKEIPGDYTVVVFSLVRFARKSPEQTASELGGYLVSHLPQVTSYEVIKGFLNLFLAENFWLDFLLTGSVEENFGLAGMRQEAPVVLEFSSPNTNKPLHLGHVRNNLLGWSLSEILKANGYPVVRVNLVNDRGIHICKSMLAYMKWGNGETPESAGMKGDHLIGRYYVMFDQHYRAEVRTLTAQGVPEEEALNLAPLMAEAREILRKWEASDPETVALWETMNGWAYDGFDKTYHRLGISFDRIYYESKTYLKGKELVLKGLAEGVLEQRPDGSVWIDLREEGLDEKLLMRSDGTSVYITQDIGTAEIRYEDYRPAEMIYVVGNEQNYHFDVLKKVLARLGKEYGNTVRHLSYGMVELPEGKMKSREGTVVDADDLMDEMYTTAGETTRSLGKAGDLSPEEATVLFDTVGLGALKYFILKVDPRKNMLFDPVESIDFNGNTGPFIQYTYARIRSLLARAAAAGVVWHGRHPGADYRFQALEKETVKRLYLFPEIIAQAGRELSPAHVANYVYDLAKGYNQMYQELPVLKEENPAAAAVRLHIAEFSANVIRRAMSLLGIGVPERM